MSGNKIVTLPKLKAIVSRLRARKKRIVFTNGCFDIIHVGHIKYLEMAKAKADILIVGINSDSSMRKIKGPMRPIIKQADRAKVVAGLEAVDYVSIFNETTPLKMITALKPDILIKGADWKLNKIVGAIFVESYGGKAITIPLIKGKSTSGIIRKIAKRFG